jgi:hypothetical protein
LLLYTPSSKRRSQSPKAPQAANGHTDEDTLKRERESLLLRRAGVDDAGGDVRDVEAGIALARDV